MAAEAGPAINPIEQFSITPLIPIRIAGHDFSLTNSSLYMLIAVGVAIIVRTGLVGGGLVGFLIGPLFAAAGLGRLYLMRHR